MAHNGITAIDQHLHRSRLFPPLTVRSTTASLQPYARHLHEDLSIGVVTHGQTSLTCRDETFTARAGEIVVFAPLEPHACNPIGGTARGYHMFYVDTDWLRKTCLPEGGAVAVTHRVLSDDVSFDKMTRLAEAVKCNSPLNNWQDVLRDIVRNSCQSILTTKVEPPKLGLTARSGVPRETFIRSFRRATGLPPGQYRQCLRLSRALRLMAEGETIVSAALASGFCDQSHFHRMCVKYLAATPAQLRPSHSSKT